MCIRDRFCANAALPLAAAWSVWRSKYCDRAPISLLPVRPFMWQRSTRFHKIQSLGCSTASLPNASRESENHSFVPSRDPSQRLPATTRRLRQNPTRPLKQKAALATSPLRANSTGCRVDNRIAASLPQRAPPIARKSARHSCTAVATQVQLARRRRGPRAHSSQERPVTAAQL